MSCILNSLLLPPRYLSSASKKSFSFCPLQLANIAAGILHNMQLLQRVPLHEAWWYHSPHECCSYYQRCEEYEQHPLIVDSFLTLMGEYVQIRFQYVECFLNAVTIAIYGKAFQRRVVTIIHEQESSILFSAADMASLLDLVLIFPFSILQAKYLRDGDAIDVLFFSILGNLRKELWYGHCRFTSLTFHHIPSPP